jgi:hypothetical protein
MVVSGNLCKDSYWYPIQLGLSSANTLGAATYKMQMLGHNRSLVWVMDGIVGGTYTQSGASLLTGLVSGDTVTAGVSIRLVSGALATGLAPVIAYYDASGTFLSATIGGVMIPSDLGGTCTLNSTVPANATQFRLGLNFAPIAILTIEHAGWFLVKGANRAKRVYINESDQLSINSIWAGKKLAVLGDSITYPSDAWHATVQKKLCMNSTLVNKAISGYTLAYPGSVGSLCTQADDLISGYASADFDIIVIAAGTNDYNAQFPLGDIDIQSSVDLASVDKTCVYGATCPCQTLSQFNS